MSVNVIDEIEAELKQISSWPWQYDERTGCIAVYENDKTFNCLDVSHTEFIAYWSGYRNEISGLPETYAKDRNNAAFLAKSPERFAALVRYVWAAEAWICRPGRPLLWVAAGLSVDAFAMHEKDLWDELQSARRELGMEKE